MTLKNYEVVIGNRRGGTKTVMKLTDEDAKRLGGKPVDDKPARSAKQASPAKPRAAAKGKAAKPANKAATPADTAATPENK